VTAGEVAALLTSVGAGAVLLKLVELLCAGRERDVVARERARAEDAERRMTAADLEADTEMRRRRKAQEYAAKLRRHAIERGVEPSDLPPWPSELLD
jgi:hypothetical protein